MCAVNDHCSFGERFPGVQILFKRSLSLCDWEKVFGSMPALLLPESEPVALKALEDLLEVYGDEEMVVSMVEGHAGFLAQDIPQVLEKIDGYVVQFLHNSAPGNVPCSQVCAAMLPHRGQCRMHGAGMDHIAPAHLRASLCRIMTPKAEKVTPSGAIPYAAQMLRKDPMFMYAVQSGASEWQCGPVRGSGRYGPATHMK